MFAFVASGSNSSASLDGSGFLASSGLQVEIIYTFEALKRLVPEWQRLDDNLRPRLPFRSPSWNLKWWTHFRRSGFLLSDTLNTYVVRDTAGTLVAVAPMMITTRPACGPFKMRELQFFGADTNLTELRGIICEARYILPVVSAIRRVMAVQSAKWDWVQWRGLPILPDAIPWDAAIPRLEPVRRVADHYLTLPESWDAFKAGLPRNVKESLRKCYNSLARAGHRFEFRVQRGMAASQAVDRFLHLHAQRAASTASRVHLDSFAAPRASAFLQDYAQGLAVVDNLRVFELVIAGQVVATRLGFSLGDELYLYFSGYDPSWGRFSVMTTVVAELLKWAIIQGIRTVNLSTGTDVSKTRWRPQRIDFVEGLEVSASRRGKLAYAVMKRIRTGSHSLSVGTQPSESVAKV